jgi:hypothetical protein
MKIVSTTHEAVVSLIVTASACQTGNAGGSVVFIKRVFEQHVFWKSSLAVFHWDKLSTRTPPQFTRWLARRTG